MNQPTSYPLMLRPMQPDDLPAVLAIQRTCYAPTMNEDASTLRGRLAAVPNFSWVGQLAGKVCAYLVTYPSTFGKITALGGDFLLPTKPDCLYFHDLAVRPEMAGSGFGVTLVTHALLAGREYGLTQAALVCVQDAFTFWQSQGFTEQKAANQAAQAALASYPGKARYMARLNG